MFSDTRLLRLNRSDHTDLLVCFPHAGAGISAFRNWPTRFKNHVGVALVQLPGREDRIHEDFSSSLFELSKAIANELAASNVNRLFLFGHSMGASIAWAVAEQLWFIHQCRPVLIVSAQSPTPEKQLAEQTQYDLPGWYELLGEKFPAALKHPELRALFETTWAIDSQWMKRELVCFHPSVLPVDVHAMYGIRDGLIARTEVAQWRNLTSRHFGLVPMQGGHLYWLDQAEPLYTTIEQLIERYSNVTS